MIYAAQETAIKRQSKLKFSVLICWCRKWGQPCPCSALLSRDAIFPHLYVVGRSSVVFIRRFFTSAGINELCDAMLSLRLLNAIARVITSLVYASSHTRRDEIAALECCWEETLRDRGERCKAILSRALFIHKWYQEALSKAQLNQAGVHSFDLFIKWGV
jgi:hypothetical protein